jgi:hypothetical protein
MHQLKVQLNPNGVAAPAQHAATKAANIILHCLGALDGELKTPETSEQSIGYRFEEIGITAEERRATYQNWLLCRAFQELLRGVRESLEEAVLFLELLSQPGEKKTTVGQWNQDLEDIRRRASNMKFPQLIAAVNSGLTEPLAFEGQFLSMQKVRNCLEHRAGIVGARDVDEGGSALTLSFPRLRIFYRRGDEDIDVVPGQTVDTGDGKDEVQIFMRLESRSRTYKIGERIVFNANDFNEVAMACHFFAGDLGRKLPLRTAQQTGADAPTKSISRL